MTETVDTIIIGGGCAGLSLASKLAAASQQLNQNKDLDVLVIEPRTQYVNDRTWCFWNQAIHPLAYKTWSSWLFSIPSTRTSHHSEHYHYQCIRAEDFYQSAIQCINQSSQVKISMGHQVEQVDSDKGGFLVHTNKGAIQAQQIIDTRPPVEGQTAQAHLHQSFVGVEVKTKQAAFNPKQVTLMGDMGADQHGFHFNYILPFSTTHALIEPTRFHLPGLSNQVLKDDLKRNLKSILGDIPYSITRSEQGKIPMGFSTAQTAHRNWVLAGTAGGAVRASSGYAFIRIQQWAEQCAKHLFNKKTALGHQPDAWIYRNMDALFLQTIKHNPDTARQLFMRMAKGLQPESLVRFLSNQARFSDIFKLVKCLPAKPFLRQLKTQSLSKFKGTTNSTSTCK